MDGKPGASNHVPNASEGLGVGPRRSARLVRKPVGISNGTNQAAARLAVPSAKSTKSMRNDLSKKDQQESQKKKPLEGMQTNRLGPGSSSLRGQKAAPSKTIAGRTNGKIESKPLPQRVTGKRPSPSTKTAPGISAVKMAKIGDKSGSKPTKTQHLPHEVKNGQVTSGPSKIPHALAVTQVKKSSEIGSSKPQHFNSNSKAGLKSTTSQAILKHPAVHQRKVPVGKVKTLSQSSTKSLSADLSKQPKLTGKRPGTVKASAASSPSKRTKVGTGSKSSLGGAKQDGHHFLKVLEEGSERIKALIDSCEGYLKESAAEMSEEVQGTLRAAIGKANLLVDQKFQQFHDLCGKNIEPKEGETVVQNGDLTGFWDLLSIQVEDVTNAFAYIEVLRANNWEKVQAEQNTVGVSKEGQKDTKKAEGARVKPAVSRPPLQSKASDEKRKQLQEFKQKMKEKMNEGHANRNADLIVI